VLYAKSLLVLEKLLGCKCNPKRKLQKSVQKISYASIIRKNLPVVVVNHKNSDQDSLETGNQIKSIFDPVESQINGLKNVSKGRVVCLQGQSFD
jgi:hypothetical protein